MPMISLRDNLFVLVLRDAYPLERIITNIDDGDNNWSFHEQTNDLSFFSLLYDLYSLVPVASQIVSSWMILVMIDECVKATANARMYTFHSCEPVVDAWGVENLKKTQKKISKLKKKGKKNHFSFWGHRALEPP